MPSMILKKGRDQRLKSGHPWVYAGEVERYRGEFEDGDVIDVKDSRERPLAFAHVNRRSQIVGRVLSFHRDPVGPSFVRDRIAEALAVRERMGLDTGVGRIVYSEADFLPGLIVDRYGGWVVLQALTLGMDRWRDTIVEALKDLLQPEGIYERSDLSVREHEGLQQVKAVLYGELREAQEVLLDGLKVRVDIVNGQKTGLFLDQRQNWGAAERLARGARVLDAFCYTGVFALHAARGGAVSTLGLDISEDAVGLARSNALLNGVEGRCTFEAGNAFDRLRALEGEGATFDLVVLDPPSFTRSRDGVEGAVRGYKEINLRALKILNPGGFLITCSCSYHMSEEGFRTVVNEAAQDARRRVRLVEVRSQAPDHPIRPSTRETQYLKCLILQAI